MSSWWSQFYESPCTEHNFIDLLIPLHNTDWTSDYDQALFFPFVLKSEDEKKAWREGSQFKLERFSFECRKGIGFAFATLHDWLKNSRQFFIQSEAKPKPIVTHSHSFSRALRQLPVITSSAHWFTVFCVFFVIRYSNYFGFVFKTLNWKPLHVHKLICDDWMWILFDIKRVNN